MKEERLPSAESDGFEAADDGGIAWAHVIYGLHTLSLLTGIFTVATVIGAFLLGWPSIIAVILNYVKRGDVRGTFLESHFRWQIRTFWLAFGWVVLGWLLLFSVIGLPLAIGIFALLGLWLVYRIARGWLALAGRRPMPV